MSDLTTLATTLLTSGPHKIEPCAKRIRVLYDGKYVTDTTAAKLVWEHPWYPQYYVPIESIDKTALSKEKTVGDGAYLATLHGKTKSTGDVLVFESSAGPSEVLSNLVRLPFRSMDQWFEEDFPIFAHPRDPHKRIDIVPSSRHVRVEIDGTVVAESTGGNMFLFETGLMARYYLPKTAAKWEYLSESQTHSLCPYKGEASYYDVTIDGKEYKDHVWWYPNPILESISVAGMLCFYNEKCDIWLDGVKQERVKSHFS